MASYAIIPAGDLTVLERQVASGTEKLIHKASWKGCRRGKELLYTYALDSRHAFLCRSGQTVAVLDVRGSSRQFLSVRLL